MIGPLGPICPCAAFLVLTSRRRFIWLDEREERCVEVDQEDYDYFSRWLWSPKLSRGGWKCYAFRSQTLRADGKRRGISLYLHVEIMRHSGILPDSARHTVVDHRNGDSLDCTRRNLRWATPSMNRLNLHGRTPRDLLEIAAPVISRAPQPSLLEGIL